MMIRPIDNNIHYMNIVFLLNNINISDYIVNIIYKNIIYIIQNHISNIVKIAT